MNAGRVQHFPKRANSGKSAPDNCETAQTEPLRESIAASRAVISNHAHADTVKDRGHHGLEAAGARVLKGVAGSEVGSCLHKACDLPHHDHLLPVVSAYFLPQGPMPGGCLKNGEMLSSERFFRGLGVWAFSYSLFVFQQFGIIRIGLIQRRRRIVSQNTIFCDQGSRQCFCMLVEEGIVPHA